MKKSILCSILGLLFLFFYVYNKINIYILAYQIENNRQKLVQMQEEKSRLEFAFYSRLSLKDLAQNVDRREFTFERKIVKLPAGLPEEKAVGSKRQTFFARVFSFTQQAEAKP